MKQVVQNRKSGELVVVDVPPPALQPGCVLVRNAFSLISAGTERSSVVLGGKSLLGKAYSRPDLVRKVIETAQREGVSGTYRRVMATLDNSNALGYSCAGVILEVGSGVEGLVPGDRVACAGAGHANHAEVVCVPRNLCAPIPHRVDVTAAAFTTLGAIAMHGVRRAQVTLGERVVVIGLGLVGQLTAQISKASGCRVLGVDIASNRVDMGLGLGLDRGCGGEPDQVREAAVSFTGGAGADAVIITAAGGDGLVELAGEISRDRGRVVVVGAVPMNVPRNPFYDKELTLTVSRSYGPGRYDPQYEEKGVDYPIGYVRWTERRNMEAFLHLVAEGRVAVGPMITHRYPVESAVDAFELITTNDPDAMGVVLTYPNTGTPELRRLEVTRPKRTKRDSLGLGLIGAGGFARGTLLPILTSLRNVQPVGVATGTGTAARDTARQFEFSFCTTDYREILGDDSIHAVVIATRHNLHAPIAIDALRAGKAVFVEKPLALTDEELAEVVSVVEETGGQLMVGFNRRFSPMVRELSDFMRSTPEPLIINYRVNAGPIAPGHWIRDPEVGGGRITGEVCHFVDTLSGLAQSAPTQVSARRVGVPHASVPHDEDLCIQMALADGSVATIVYACTGDASFPKERIEVFGGGAVGVIDDFRTLSLSRDGRSKTRRSRQQDKGHREELTRFIEASRGNADLASLFQESVLTTRATLKIASSLDAGTWQTVSDPSSEEV